MNNLFLVGDRASVNGYIDNYLKQNFFTPFEIEYFDDPVKIGDARDIKNVLSYKMPTKKIFIFRNSCTTEAQNALLKNIEDAVDNVFFIFSSVKEDSLLPTVRSRCLVVRLSSDLTSSVKITELIKNVSERDNDWAAIDDLITFLDDHDLEDIVPALRQLLLASIDQKNVTRYFHYCKKSLPLISLSKTNNMNRKIVIESIFI